MSQDALAQQAGVNKMTIWRLEKGTIKDVKGEVLGKLAVALGVSADYLLGLQEE
jgi:transcriptional regulator with XRE-family HTH domain